jgi:hypothetical protein
VPEGQAAGRVVEGPLTGGMFYGGVGVCPCHGDPWHLSRRSGGRRGQKRQCIHKVRAQWTRRDNRRDKTPARIAWKARSNAKRVGHGGFESYIGMAPTPETAEFLNGAIRQFAEAQKGRTHAE